MEPKHPIEPGGRRGLARREFLVLSAVGILTPWVGRLAEAAALPISGSIGAAPAVAPARPMSIGYVEGSDTILSFRSLPWEGLSLLSDSTPPEERFGYQVTPARELTLGNQNMASTVARINVHGLYPSGNWGTRETLESVDLEIYFPNPDPASSRPLPFHAWSFRRWPARNAGQRISFNMPVGIDGGPQISLIVGRRGEAQRQRYDANFTVDWASGRPKLQQGIYLLGLGPATWDSRVSLPAPGERQRIDLRSVVISVETSPLVRRLGH